MNSALDIGKGNENIGTATAPDARSVSCSNLETTVDQLEFVASSGMRSLLC